MQALFTLQELFHPLFIELLFSLICFIADLRPESGVGLTGQYKEKDMDSLVPPE
jgi:hypothetical protein